MAQAGRTIGRRSCYTERCVSGPSPYGGEWNHGWRRESVESAEAHAREMASHDRVPWVRVQTRIVETEIVAETMVRCSADLPLSAQPSVTREGLEAVIAE